MLSNIAKNGGITVNIPKTKILAFKKGGRLSKREKWTYQGTIIETVKNFKYVGCIFSPSGNFTACMDELMESSRRALFVLSKLFRTNPEILPVNKIQLFNSKIMPILSYASEIWGMNNIDSIECFYLSFLKSVLGVKKATPNCYVYGELGIYPLKIEFQMRAIKYWLKIISLNLPHESYIRKIYIELLLVNIHFPNTVTWITKIRDILFKCGMGSYWFDQKVGDEEVFLIVLRQRLTDMYLQEWHSNIEASSNNRLYKHLKDKHNFENYLNINNNYFRTAITKIRLSSHVFNVERGRWGKLPLRDRLCNLCLTTEDEFHVFIECPRYKKIREHYLPHRLKYKPSMDSFIRYLKCENMSEIMNIGRLCAMLQKEHKLYV